MPGLYFHIPFCKTKCSYCDFYSIARKNIIPEFIKSLVIEIEKKSHIFKNKLVNTIYFGGGTPSFLEIYQIEQILKHIQSHFRLSENLEFTFEANPEDLNNAYLRNLRDLGINRLSIGVQSLDDNILKFLRRRHTVNQTVSCIENAYKLGFSNISADLIYGIPNMSIDLWKKSLNVCLDLPISHLSAYHLTIEEKTLLHKQYKNREFNLPEDKNSLNQFKKLVKISESRDFYLYEISNLAKLGMESQHNSAYWKHFEYLGFGPSAHSFYENKRSYNISDIKLYVNSLNTSEPFYEEELLTTKELLNESIMLALRTVKGLDLEKFREKFGQTELDEFLSRLKHVRKEHYQIHNQYLSLNLDGLFVSDDIISTLFK